MVEEAPLGGSLDGRALEEALEELTEESSPQAAQLEKSPGRYPLSSQP